MKWMGKIEDKRLARRGGSLPVGHHGFLLREESPGTFLLGSFEYPTVMVVPPAELPAKMASRLKKYAQKLLIGQMLCCLTFPKRVKRILNFIMLQMHVVTFGAPWTLIELGNRMIEREWLEWTWLKWLEN